MRGYVAQVCDCRDPETGRRLGARCPKLPRRARNGEPGRKGIRGHGSWAFVVGVVDPLTGKRRQIHRQGFPTRAAAEDALESIVGKARDGVAIDDKLTVGAWLDMWLAGKTSTSGVSGVGRTIRLSTARSYGTHVRLYLKPLLGHYPLAKLRAEQVAAAYDAILAAAQTRRGKPMSATTLRRVHATLASAMSAAVKVRRIDRDPTEHVELPDVTRKQVQPWTAGELGVFLDFVAGTRLGPLFELMAATGLRRGEALGLRWKDVDLQAGTLTVRQQAVQLGSAQARTCDLCGDGHPRVGFGRPKTKAGEDRVVSLGRHALGVLLSVQLRQADEAAAAGEAFTDHGLVFTWQDGKPYSPDHVTSRFVDLVKASGLRQVRLHDLRHGAASLMLAAGIPLGVVSKRLGHSQLSLTSDLYQHLLPETDRQAAEAVEELIPRSRRYGNVRASGPMATVTPLRSDESAGQTWGGRGLNPRPTDYESAALTG